MKIETKFNAGDKVWIVVFDSVYLKFVPEYRIIDQIKIKISNGGEKFSLKYYLYFQNGYYNEDRLYPTGSECQIACDQKNDEIYHRKI